MAPIDMTDNGGHPAADPRITFFDRIAASWDTEEQDPSETICRLQGLCDLLALKPNDNLVEVGCGTGQLTNWLAALVHPGRVLAIDFSPEMIRKASSKVTGEVRLADVCSDDLGQAEFDVALCFHSFPHFRDPLAALRNLAGCLKPQGRLIVLHLNSRAKVNAFHQSVGGIVATDLLPSDSEWERWLGMAGMEKQELIDGPDLFFLQAGICADN